MTPEKIMEWFGQLGGGLVLLGAALVAAVVIVAFARLRKKGGHDRSKSDDNPAGEAGNQS